ncbi:phosphoglycerate mutase [Spirosoma sp. HMF3257]|uniref:Phosphoglycerate mutase n=1 Tax=Spirosoma telluris TaxID=2183553 RepID=A0A327NPH0_9BACT|nr:phosphoglycerate mutase [Spirosoma telluris]RAI77067.1 phosphoglycerate mutase [Spirosoma telluris]
MHLLYSFLLITCSLLTACSTTTVYIVRHAEKVNETDTTNLTPAGFARATALAEKLGNQHVDSIFTTPYRRTRQTAQPLAQRLGLQLVDYPAKPTEAIVNRVNAMKNKTVLVVGHSNTILEIAKGLGAQPTLTKIEAGDFDNLLQVKIRRGLFKKSSITVGQTTYGQLTPP